MDGVSTWGGQYMRGSEQYTCILTAIVDGLDEEIQWSNTNQWQELATVYQGIFIGCVGIADAKEFQVVKYEDMDKERRSWSREKNQQL